MYQYNQNTKYVKKCGSYHYPCLYVFEKKKKRDERRRIPEQAIKRQNQDRHQKIL